MLSASAGSESGAGLDVVLGFVQLQVALTERLVLALTVGDRSPAQPKHLCGTGSTPGAVPALGAPQEPSILYPSL